MPPYQKVTVTWLRPGCVGATFGQLGEGVGVCHNGGMKKIIFVFIVSLVTDSFGDTGTYSYDDYIRRCDKSPVPPENVPYCSQHFNQYLTDFNKRLHRTELQVQRLEKSADSNAYEQNEREARERLERMIAEEAAVLESLRRVEDNYSASEDQKRLGELNTQIQSTERYLANAKNNPRDSFRKSKDYAPAIRRNEALLEQLKAERERIQKRLPDPKDSLIAGQLETPHADGSYRAEEPVKSRDLPVESKPAVGATPAADPIWVNQQREEEIDQNQLRAFRNQLNRKDVENEFASLRHQNLSLQLRLRILQEKYDNTLMGAYIQSSLGKLLQSNLACEKKANCTPRTQDIPNLKDKLKTQIFQNTRQEQRR